MKQRVKDRIEASEYKYTPPKRITWADAELLWPGVTNEWRSMVGQEGTCIPPAGVDYRLEVHDWDGKPKLHVIQIDHEKKWESPPEWRCWPQKDGTRQWTHPIPLPKTLLFYLDFRYDVKGLGLFYLDYRYDIKKDRDK